MAKANDKIARVRYNPDAKYKIIIELWDDTTKTWDYSTGWKTTEGAVEYVNADILYEIGKLQRMGYTVNVY